MTTKKSICVFTGSRAEYGILEPLLREIKLSNSLELNLVVGSMHLSHEYGNTFKQIEQDGHLIDEKIDNLDYSNNISAIPKSAANLQALFSDYLLHKKPDLVLLLGDRYETHAAASTSLLMNIPVGHIHGGELSEGSIDEQLRHSITKMSHIHFCANEVYRKRIIQMGESPKNVFNTGSPGLDYIFNTQFLKTGEIMKEFDWENQEPYLLFTYHSETIDSENLESKLTHIFEFLKETGFKVLFSFSNSDYGGGYINKRIKEFCKTNSSKYKVYPNLGRFLYLSAMKNCLAVVGNSSSGLIEAEFFGKPCLNIGDRQKGRLRGKNVIDSDYQNLRKNMKVLLSKEFLSKLSYGNCTYGDGNGSKKIVKILELVDFDTRKSFFNVS